MLVDAGCAERSTSVHTEFDCFDFSDVGMVVADPTGQLRRVNNAFGHLVGRSPEELIGAPLFSLTEPACTGDNEALMARLLAKGSVKSTWIETRCLLPDGTVVWVDLAVRPIFDSQGVLTGSFIEAFDVTDRKLAEDGLRRKLHEFEEAQRVAQLGSFEHDPESDMVEISTELARIFGIEASSAPIPAARVMAIVHPEDRERLGAAIRACITNHVPVDLTHRLQLSDGTRRWVHTRGDEGEHEGNFRFVGTVLDITDGKVIEDALTYEETHDSLTGLINRSRFVHEVDWALRTAQPDAGQNAILLLDVDDFKTVNDSLGHALGDELLIELSRRLIAAARTEDIVARIGGDEFAVLVASGDARLVSEQLARGIADMLRVPFTLLEHKIELSASIGISVSEPTEDSGALLRDADLAMYLAKKNGKARFEIAEAGMQERALERLDSIADLQHGVEHHEFEVYYQAIVDTQTSELAGAEALVRWNHPRRGLLLPNSFIELAETSALIVPIGRGVRHEACRQLAEWRSTGIVDDDFYISVNLATRQLAEPTLVDNVALDLDDAGLPARALVLEITESTLMSDFDARLAPLRALRAAGLRIALDDYGTGYSSLARLSETSIDIVKIDKSFIDGVAVDKEGRAIVQSVIDAADALGMDTVAEGVEEQEQCDVLTAMGCTYVQGYLFSKPRSSVDIEPTLRALRAPPRIHPAEFVEHLGRDVSRNLEESRPRLAKVITLWQGATSRGGLAPAGLRHPESIIGDGRRRSRAGDRSFRVGARALLSAPSLCINVFWGAAMASVSILAISKHWSSGQLLTLLIIIGICICGFSTRICIGSRLPEWMMHIDLSIAMLICMTLVAVGDSAKLDFSDFFVWVVLYAAIYLRPHVVLGYFIAVCTAFGVVLSFGPRVANPATSWLMLFTSSAIVTLVVFGVVSLLRASGLEDPLTGLANRRSFDERLREELERSRRSLDPLSVAMIDLDGFKAVNDQFGHGAGDSLLRELARMWSTTVRDGGDFLARIGGDEFVVIAPNSDDLGIRRVAERLANSLPDRVHCSIGTATWDRSENSSNLVHRADQRMYERKILRHRDERLHQA